MAKGAGSFPTLEHEFEFGYPLRTLVGLDEVGRGCIAGPVVAAAAVLPIGIERARGNWQPEWLRDIQDSKKLSEKDRNELSTKLKGWLAGYSVAFCTPEEIDEINIHHASLTAMNRAVDALPSKLRQNAFYLVDGKWIPKGLKDSRAIIKGDLKCLSIACSSIIAKVHRDDWMARLDSEYTGYGLAQHKGYPTPAHITALEKQGCSPIHRKTFGPVSRVLAG